MINICVRQSIRHSQLKTFWSKETTIIRFALKTREIEILFDFKSSIHHEMDVLFRFTMITWTNVPSFFCLSYSLQREGTICTMQFALIGLYFLHYAFHIDLPYGFLVIIFALNYVMKLALQICVHIICTTTYHVF